MVALDLSGRPRVYVAGCTEEQAVAALEWLRARHDLDTATLRIVYGRTVAEALDWLAGVSR